LYLCLNNAEEQMQKNKVILSYQIALCSGEKPPVVRQSFASSAMPDIRCFDTAHLVLINRVQNKSRGIKQSNLFPVSAGNDLTVSTMRPNPYLSAGIVERRSKHRGFLQFNTQSI